MEGGLFSVVVDNGPSQASSSGGLQKGQDGRPSAAEGRRSLDSYAFIRRHGLVAFGEEDEESEGSLAEQDLKGAYIELVKGVQEWPDGCVYQGEFGLNMKLGHGEFSWPTGETYRGQFYRDHCHGVGTYTWPDGSSFTGMFYLSHREGYGTMYTKTRLFQGLYRADQRFGPGVETHADGSQDVGLWFHEHLIKLATETPNSFSLLKHPEFSAFLTRSRERVRLSEEDRAGCVPRGQDPFSYEYKRFLLDDDLALPPDMYVYSTDNRHLPMPGSLRRELDARLFVNDIPPFVEDGEPWLLMNETPLLAQIQKQAYKFRNKKAHTSWNMGAILEGNRSAFACSGPRERLSKEMILKAEAGDRDWIYGVLRDNLAHADVADSKGYTVLAAATVHGHNDVVNLLLDYGADVNKRTDEGLTPLNLCFLLYYPSRTFKPNIAERTVCPQEPPKLLVTSRLSSFVETNLESLDEVAVPVPDAEEQKRQQRSSGSPEDGLVPGTRSSLESTGPRSSPRVGEASSVKSSLSGLEEGLEDEVESSGQSSPCSNSDFESSLCVHNFSIRFSRDALEKSAEAYSLLQDPSLGDKGTVRRMAQCLAKRRSQWLTIKLLLRRGADPNLCRVPMQALFLAVKAGDVDGVRLLLENGARTDIQFPLQLRALTPLHIAAALPGEEGVRITELLLHAITDVDAKAADQDDVYKPGKLDLLPSSLKLNNEPGPPSTYYTAHTGVPEEGGRTALHVACEREDNKKCARDIVRLLLSHKAKTHVLWSGHSPLSLSVASGNDLIVKELLSQGADPNLPLSRGYGSALCVVCDLAYEQQRSTEGKIALIDRLIDYGADILKPVTLTQGDKVAVGTAVDYGYFKFFQDRKIAHCPFHALMPVERETFLARKRLLEYMGAQLRRAVLARESQWDPQALYLSKRVELAPSHRLKKRGSTLARSLSTERKDHLPFFKFCYQCGRSVGVRLTPCPRCYTILTCSKYCKTKAWAEFHKKDCSDSLAMVSYSENTFVREDGSQ